MASVTTAMHRLSEMGLIHYNQREFIELTPEGEEQARRTITRHDLLVRFFEEVLHVSAEKAGIDACAMEHYLSDESVDHMVRLFEFMKCCPKGNNEFLTNFHKCSVINPEVPPCNDDCELCKGDPSENRRVPLKRQLSELRPGETATIIQVKASGAIRQRLIDMGMLPNTIVEVERKAPGGNPIWIKLKGFQLSLRRIEAESVTVVI